MALASGVWTCGEPAEPRHAACFGMVKASQEVVKSLPPCSGQQGSVAAPLFGSSACCLNFVCHCCLLLPAEDELKLSAAIAAS